MKPRTRQLCWRIRLRIYLLHLRAWLWKTVADGWLSGLLSSVIITLSIVYLDLIISLIGTAIGFTGRLAWYRLRRQSERYRGLDA